MVWAGTFLDVFLPFPVPLQGSVRFAEFRVHTSKERAHPPFVLVTALPKRMPSMENKWHPRAFSG